MALNLFVPRVQHRSTSACAVRAVRAVLLPALSSRGGGRKLSAVEYVYQEPTRKS